ncbi:MAG: hypothetical protein M1827_000458 [Pycnora praestabilis]|nr:MAG: hypothetical protein M1827_000458 [Pycnora praestabilis]
MVSIAGGCLLQEAQRIIQYQFNDPLLLWEALQAAGSGVYRIGNRHLFDGNKRLAILGDTVLKLVLVEHWYNGVEDRGRASQVVSDVGSNVNLDRVGRANGIDACINKNPAQGRMVSPGTMTATIEAILGAVYLDSGMIAAAQVMQTLSLVPI